MKFAHKKTGVRSWLPVSLTYINKGLCYVCLEVAGNDFDYLQISSAELMEIFLHQMMAERGSEFADDIKTEPIQILLL